MTVKKENVRDLGIRVQYAPWYRGIEILISGISDDHQKRYVMTATDFEEMDINNPIGIEPSLSISLEAAQTLMDDLWACGIRPTEGKGSAGALAATERHLEDMRTLVFKAEIT